MARNKRNRTSKRRASKKNQTRNFYLGIGGFVTLLVIAGIYLYLDQPPEVSASRLELETSLGADDAQVTIYEFASYGCEACRYDHERGFNAQVEALLEQPEFEGKVRFVYVNYPIISINDPLSAEAAQCALDQGSNEFWTFHNEIYEISDAEYATMRGVDDFVDFADRIGLDSSSIESCLNSDTHERTVQYHKRRGDERFVQGTPTYFVNNQRVNRDIANIEQWVRAELN